LSESRSCVSALDLLHQQRVGALQFLVTHEQALDAFDDLVDLGGTGHV
jgi:hypothetical protein